MEGHGGVRPRRAGAGGAADAAGEDAAVITTLATGHVRTAGRGAARRAGAGAAHPCRGLGHKRPHAVEAEGLGEGNHRHREAVAVVQAGEARATTRTTALARGTAVGVGVESGDEVVWNGIVCRRHAAFDLSCLVLLVMTVLQIIREGGALMSSLKIFWQFF